jgi:hypothetical protein
MVILYMKVLRWVLVHPNPHLQPSRIWHHLWLTSSTNTWSPWFFGLGTKVVLWIYLITWNKSSIHVVFNSSPFMLITQQFTILSSLYMVVKSNLSMGVLRLMISFTSSIGLGPLYTNTKCGCSSLVLVHYTNEFIVFSPILFITTTEVIQNPVKL